MVLPARCLSFNVWHEPRRFDTQLQLLTDSHCPPAAPFPMFYGAGSWADYCVVSETALVAVPDGVPDEVAAQFFVRHLFTPPCHHLRAALHFHAVRSHAVHA
jgi:hypothetical protein